MMDGHSVSTTDRAVTVKRTIPSSAERVFAAWTSADTIKRVLGLSRVELDARVGGRYRFETDGDDESPGRHVVWGEYKHLTRGRRIVQTWFYEGPMLPGERLETLVTLELRAIRPDLVEVSVREEGSLLADGSLREFALDAWTTALSDLELALLGRAA